MQPKKLLLSCVLPDFCYSEGGIDPEEAKRFASTLCGLVVSWFLPESRDTHLVQWDWMHITGQDETYIGIWEMNPDPPQLPADTRSLDDLLGGDDATINPSATPPGEPL